MMTIDLLEVIESVTSQALRRVTVKAATAGSEPVRTHWCPSDGQAEGRVLNGSAPVEKSAQQAKRRGWGSDTAGKRDHCRTSGHGNRLTHLMLICFRSRKKSRSSEKAGTTRRVLPLSTVLIRVAALCADKKNPRIIFQ
jgi:hypothetical protein